MPINICIEALTASKSEIKRRLWGLRTVPGGGGGPIVEGQQVKERGLPGPSPRSASQLAHQREDVKKAPKCLPLKGEGRLSRAAAKASHLAELGFHRVMEVSIFLYSLILGQVLTGELSF